MALHETQKFAGLFRKVGFLHQRKVYIFRFSFLKASFSYLPCDGATFLPGDMWLRMCANFHWRPYTALHETHEFAGPYRRMLLLHHWKIYIFSLSFLKAFFSHALCVGATLVPDDR